jgi:MFS transporter, DHA2 family, lincomycin resistance protein
VLWSMTQLTTHTPPGYILAGHVVMSVGFALLFTPLFTTSLSSLPFTLYSHGSATLSSVQQVAGAAGVSLLIALMSSRSAQLLARGSAPLDALTAGIRAAFLTAASLSLLAVACIWFVRRPQPQAPAPPP